jgi:hypothetical protein
MKLEIEITTHDRMATFELLEATSLSPGQALELADGLVVNYRGTLVRKSVGWPEVSAFLLAVASNLPASVAADLIWNWLKSKLSSPPERLTIDRTVIEFEEGEVKRVIVEKISER